MAVEAEGKTRFRIVDPVLDLLRTDKAKRLLALDRLRPLLDRSFAETRVIFPRLARQKNVHRRMRSLLELKQQSFVNQLKQIADELSQKNQFNQRVARPISVAALLRHLRLPVSFTQEQLPIVLDQAADTLVAEEGFQEAFERVASLPILLPKTLRDGFERLATPQKEEIIAWWMAKTTSPLLRFQGASLLLAGGDAEQTLAIEIIESVSGLETADIWQLFEEILVWTENWLNISDEKRSYREVTTLAATWVHAARVMHLLTVAKDPGHLADVFRANSPSPTSCVFDPAFNNYHEVSDPRRFSRTRFLVLGLSHLLGGISLGAEQRNRLNTLLRGTAFPTETPGVPALVLLEQRTNASNRLGSFLGTCNTDSLAAILGQEMADRFSDATIARDVSGYIESLSSEADTPENWVCLAAYLTIGMPPTHLHAVFQQAAFRMSFKALKEPTLNQLQLIAMFLFAQAPNCDNESAADLWEAKLLELAEVVFDEKRLFPKREAALLIGNSAFLLSTGVPDEIQAVMRFNQLLAKVVQRWNLAADVLLQPATKVLLRQKSRLLAQSLRCMTLFRSSAKRLQQMQ